MKEGREGEGRGGERRGRKEWKRGLAGDEAEWLGGSSEVTKGRVWR